MKPQRGKRLPAVSRSPGRGAGLSAAWLPFASDRESVWERGHRHTHPQRGLDGSCALRGAAAWGRAGARSRRRWPWPGAEAADGGHRWRRGWTRSPGGAPLWRVCWPRAAATSVRGGSAGVRSGRAGSGGNRQRARVSWGAERHRGPRPARGPSWIPPGGRDAPREELCGGE